MLESKTVPFLSDQPSLPASLELTAWGALDAPTSSARSSVSSPGLSFYTSGHFHISQYSSLSFALFMCSSPLCPPTLPFTFPVYYHKIRGAGSCYQKLRQRDNPSSHRPRLPSYQQPPSWASSPRRLAQRRPSMHRRRLLVSRKSTGRGMLV